MLIFRNRHSCHFWLTFLQAFNNCDCEIHSSEEFCNTTTDEQTSMHAPWFDIQSKQLIGLLTWLFKLGTEPRHVHWCLLSGDMTCSSQLHDIKLFTCTLKNLLKHCSLVLWNLFLIHYKFNWKKSTNFLSKSQHTSAHNMQPKLFLLFLPKMIWSLEPPA